VKLSFCLLALAGAIAAPAANAATILKDAGGLVTGVTGLVVDGKTYNVSFHNLCVEAYGSCSSNADFVFGSQNAAFFGAQSFVLNVFSGVVDSRTLGCEATYQPCNKLIAYRNGAGSLSGVFLMASGATVEFAPLPIDFSNLSFVRFTLESSAVPEPATWGLMLAGFGLVGAGLRTRRRSVTFSAA
jgi:hypothetical protein